METFWVEQSFYTFCELKEKWRLKGKGTHEKFGSQGNVDRIFVRVNRDVSKIEKFCKSMKIRVN